MNITSTKIKYGILFALFVFVVGAESVEAGTATLKIDPPQGTFYVGSSFDVSVILDTGDETVNAVETELRFPPNILQVTTPTAARSFIAIWTSPPTYSNQEGFVKFQGGVPSPGLKTSQGILSTITFRATQPGNVVIELKNSRVLLADGSGTNIFSSALGARYSIRVPPPQGPLVYSPTHPEPAHWYRDRNVSFAWEREEGVSEFSWLLDQVPNGVPDTDSEGDRTSITYDSLDDGLWYFHIRAKKGDAWGGITTFSVKIDNSPPAQFAVALDPKDKVTEKTRVLALFGTTDALSGVERYEMGMVNVSESGTTQASTLFIEGQSPFVLPEVPVGIYTVLIRAYDLAGNFRESSVTLEVRKPSFAPFLTRGLNIGITVILWPLAILVSLGITGFLGFQVLRRWREHKQVKIETKKSVGNLKGRLREELLTMQQKIASDANLRERMGRQLKNIERLAGSSSTEQEQLGKFNEEDNEAKNSRVQKLSLFFLCGLIPLFFVTAGKIADAQTSSLSPPEILTYQVELASNQLLFLTGIAPPKSIVELTISGEHQAPINAELLADDEGNWEHLGKLYLQPGFYSVTARSRLPTGEFTNPSEPVNFRVTSRVFGRDEEKVGSELIFGIAVIGSVILDVVFVGILFYLWRSAVLLRRNLRKEVGEVNEVLEKDFAILRHELGEDLTALGKDLSLSGNKSALEKEEEIKRILLQDLDRMERAIQKEISDVETLL